MKNTDDELTAVLARIDKEFRQDELAYLATTTKVEGPFRDRLSFLLHLDYYRSGFVVAREWNRVDLAVLSSAGEPITARTCAGTRGKSASRP